MSAVPKKKFCWNCEENVAKEVEHCPYCGVYLHGVEINDDPVWNSSYQIPSTKNEEIPSPLYQIKPDIQQNIDEDDDSNVDNKTKPFAWNPLFDQLKQDLFPILFLMMGSIFFLFGIVLLLFSQNGTLTLQWQESHGLYFLFFAFPLIALGWKFLQQLKVND